MFERVKDIKENKIVVYNNPLIKISFQYLPFSTQPNQLKIADFCVFMYFMITGEHGWSWCIGDLESGLYAGKIHCLFFCKTMEGLFILNT